MATMVTRFGWAGGEVGSAGASSLLLKSGSTRNGRQATA
jgi:hypothetical protein